MRVETIAVGDEILAGHTRDTNFATITTILAHEGITPSQHTIVPDDREALGRELAAALKRAPLVIMTGGLGATPDDVTRRVMASVLGRKLIFREGVLNALRAKYTARGLTMGAASEAMALVPSGAQPLDNAVGIAPGLMLRTEQSMLFALPGVPPEMERMLIEQVIPILRREGLAGTVLSETLRTAGVSEMTLAEWVRPLLEEGVRCAFLPSLGRVDLRLWVTDRDREARALLESRERITAKLGPALYGQGEETLEAVVVERLVQRGLSLGVAESLTGGQISAALTSVAGSSRIYQGTVVAYSNRAKEQLLGVSPATLQAHGAVSGPVAEEMATGARQVLEATVGIATTGIAGPGGGTPQKPVGLVYFGLSNAKVRRSLRYQMGGSRAMIKARCVSVALNMLRLMLIDRLDLLWGGERGRPGPHGRH